MHHNIVQNISFYDSKQSEYNFNKPYSDATAELIDEEVKKLISNAYKRTLNLLKKHKTELETVAKELLDKEIIFQADLERLIGKRPFEQPTTYQAFADQKNSKKGEKADIDENLENAVGELKKNILTKINEEDIDSTKKSKSESSDNK